MALSSSIPKNPLIQGAVSVVRGNILHGWLAAPYREVRPLILVDNVPAVLLETSIHRPEIARAFGFAETDALGFACRIPVASPRGTVTLYCVTPDGIYLVTSQDLGHAICASSLTFQLQQAARIARKKDTVGIVCWDGSHNPIGRAKVLYDVASAKQPAVLLCYLHEEFGGSIWPPLQHCDLPLVMIPWEQRREGHVLLRRHGITFDTVWICKPRLPSFQLAAAVSHENTKYILDIDDDEDAFSAFQTDSRTCYDAPGQGLAHFLRDQIPARTVASQPLQARFGGRLVRHVRRPAPCPPQMDRQVYRVGFVGTVRPHKQLLPIARALRILSASTRLPLQLHIYGDVQPPEHGEELERHGAVLHTMLDMTDLPKVLADLHVLISGFPPAVADERTRSILEHQIPAKLSDALATGRPILVPETPATADLANIPGIYLFTMANFTEQIVAALGNKAGIRLPEEFSPEGAHAAFTAARKVARPASVVRALAGIPTEDDSGNSSPALVLLWKQQDAGLYGRRVDQIARSYRRHYPQHRVILLEFCPEKNAQKSFSREDFTDESSVKALLLGQKRVGLWQDGVFLQTLFHSSAQDLRRQLFSFLTRHRLSPDNTLLVLFPLIDALEEVEDILHPYIRIVDVVDNQLGWAADDARCCRLLDQYFRLMTTARHVIFNSDRTRGFFAERHFLDNANVSVIPNWYTLPDGIQPTCQPLSGSARHLFYSGNMNDRLDWPLLEAIAALPDIQLHLAGTAQRAKIELDRLIARGVIYHGVIPEKETLALLPFMDAAIVPHRLDRISIFMNPIKIGMYKAIGLPVLCPAELQLGDSELLEYVDVSHCLSLLKNLPKRKAVALSQNREAMQRAEMYLHDISKYHPSADAE